HGGDSAKSFQQQFVSVVQVGGRKFFQEGGRLFERWRSGKVFGHEGFDGNVENTRQFTETGYGNVAEAAFHVGEEAQGKLAFSGKLLLRQAAALADGPESFSQLL